MLSTGIKNSVLIVLIILILHFFIKNVLLAKKETFAAPPPKCTTTTFKPEDDASAVRPFNEKPLSTKEVYDEWFGAGSDKKESKHPVGDDLDMYFAGEVDIKKEIEAATKCTIPVHDTELPKSSTCDPNLDSVPDEFLVKKDVKANCNIIQDKKNIMILNEYENENIMNGGKLFMNLEAYDNQESMFAPL